MFIKPWQVQWFVCQLRQIEDMRFWWRSDHYYCKHPKYSLTRSCILLWSNVPFNWRLCVSNVFANLRINVTVSQNECTGSHTLSTGETVTVGYCFRREWNVLVWSYIHHAIQSAVIEFSHSDVYYWYSDLPTQVPKQHCELCWVSVHYTQWWAEGKLSRYHLNHTLTTNWCFFFHWWDLWKNTYTCVFDKNAILLSVFDKNAILLTFVIL